MIQGQYFNNNTPSAPPPPPGSSEQAQYYGVGGMVTNENDGNVAEAAVIVEGNMAEKIDYSDPYQFNVISSVPLTSAATGATGATGTPYMISGAASTTTTTTTMFTNNAITNTQSNQHVVEQFGLLDDGISVAMALPEGGGALYNVPVADAFPVLPEASPNQHHFATAPEAADAVALPAEAVTLTNPDNSRWFSDVEFNDLMRRPMPICLYRPDHSNVDKDGRIDLTPFTHPPPNMPPVYDYSLAETHYDGDGFKSCDILLSSVPEILKFLHTYNTRPRVTLYTEGYHHETHVVHYTTTDSKGHTHHHTRTETRKVIDWTHNVDLTCFVFPFGKLYSTSNVPIEVVIQNYLDETNNMKTLEVKKVVEFDYGTLQNLVYGYIRQMGWSRGLTVTYRFGNNSIRVWEKTCIASAYENDCCFCIMACFILPALILYCYRDKEKAIQSQFKITANAHQVFNAIQHLIWFPGHGNRALININVFR